MNDNKNQSDLQLQSAIVHLLEGLTDKDESVRSAIEISLMKISEKHNNSMLLVLHDYKTKHQKLTELTSAAILRRFLESVL